MCLKKKEESGSSAEFPVLTVELNQKAAKQT